MSLPEKFKAFIIQGSGQEPKLEEVPLQKPGKNQVLVKVAFAPVNPSDIMTSEGFYRIPDESSKRVGLEGSGIIVAVGEDLKVPHSVGDNVHIVSLGTYGQYLVANSEDCRKVQEGLSLEEAACHWINPGAVVGMAHLVQSQGQNVAIHTAGSSALGKMLIRYFKLKGIKTINIVRRDDVIEELKEEGAGYVLNSKAPDFEEKLREIAHKEAAKISFEAVCGDLTEKILNNQPDGSTCYIYGGLSGGEVTKLNIQHFIFEGKSLSGFWLSPYFEKNIKGEEKAKLLDEMYALLPTIFKSEIQKVFKLDEVKEALAYYQQNSSKGKILIQPN